MSRLPGIGVSACPKTIAHNRHHSAGDRYLRPVAGGSSSNIDRRRPTGAASAPTTLHHSALGATPPPGRVAFDGGPPARYAPGAVRHGPRNALRVQPDGLLAAFSASRAKRSAPGVRHPG